MSKSHGALHKNYQRTKSEERSRYVAIGSARGAIAAMPNSRFLSRQAGIGMTARGGCGNAPPALSQSYGQAERAISTAQLNVSPRLHLPPIKRVIFPCPSYP